MRPLLIDSVAGVLIGLPQFIAADASARARSASPNAWSGRRRTDMVHASMRTVSAKKRSPVSTITSVKRCGMPRTLMTDNSAPTAVRPATQHQIELPTCGNMRPISSTFGKPCLLLLIVITRNT